ncbi:MAG: BlaI/MecI/CopY family transcriptional regulator [Micrococcaceae bacterium]|nr:BlaI/MecI/CopY family transcriptional regulator [Micrococcaceae bacterium]
MTTSPHGAPQLGELEQQVMSLLWQAHPRSVRQVMDALPSSPAYTTIATVMQNLRTKNMVRSQHDGRFVFYVPQVGREEYIARQMHQALDTSHDKAASILHFVQDMPEDGLQMLRNYLGQP